MEFHACGLVTSKLLAGGAWNAAAVPGVEGPGGVTVAANNGPILEWREGFETPTWNGQTQNEGNRTGRASSYGGVNAVSCNFYLSTSIETLELRL